MEFVVTLVFALWLLGSIIGQVQSEAVQKWRRWDILSCIPQYNFFAPIPGTKDFHLLCRYQETTGEFTPWRELTSFPPVQLHNIVWNPMRRYKKAVFDVATSLLREAKNYDGEALQLSVSYLAILNYISHLPAPQIEPVDHCQFMIVLSHGYRSEEEPLILFTSQVHRL